MTTIQEALEELNNEDNFIGYIYKITNLIDDKIYIGKTTYPIEKRYYAHLWTSEHKNDTRSKIHNAIRKYGKENFKVEKIEDCDSIKLLNERERYWIKELKAQNSDIGYNIAPGGEGGIGGPMFAGHHHSEETKAKMSVDRQGEKNANFGNRWHQSDELRKRHSELSSGENNGMWGKKHSEESKFKNNLSHIGKKAYSNQKLNKVIMLTPEEGRKLLNNDSNWFEGNIHKK